MLPFIVGWSWDDAVDADTEGSVALSRTQWMMGGEGKPFGLGGGDECFFSARDRISSSLRLTAMERYGPLPAPPPLARKSMDRDGVVLPFPLRSSPRQARLGEPIREPRYESREGCWPRER